MIGYNKIGDMVWLTYNKSSWFAYTEYNARGFHTNQYQGHQDDRDYEGLLE